MRFRVFTMAMLLAAVNYCLPAYAVDNGKSAQGNDFVVPLSIIYSDPSKPGICSGAMLSSIVVVTAAHCVQDKDGKKAKIRVGLAGGINTPTSEWVAVLSSFLPPTYKNGGEITQPDDIAFLELVHPVSFSSNIHIATLDELKLAENSINEFPYKVHSYGYGPTDLANWNIFPGEISGFMQSQVYLNSPLYTNFANVWAFNSLGAGTCGGDSGGPVTYEDNGTIFLIGVIDGTYKNDGNCTSSGVINDQQTSKVSLTILARPYFELFKAAVDKAEADKNKSITCIKGKLMKKISGVAAVCPKGFRSKAQ